MAKYTQRQDGEWVDVTNGHLMACCDCGLVHETEYKILDGSILVRAFKDKRETASRRQRKDVKQSIAELKGKPHVSLLKSRLRQSNLILENLISSNPELFPAGAARTAQVEKNKKAIKGN